MDIKTTFFFQPCLEGNETESTDGAEYTKLNILPSVSPLASLSTLFCFACHFAAGVFLPLNTK